ncbi:MAG: organoarsenical effux MFS transporter ArsJ [Gammaproteobacteria bacterium]|nr:organoarsenical effux MFS transporter ArsJ [Gammaproteobacteria bacterium]MDP2139985.1 organoarsenical effux MFS transporter ArsJ [Gammaproteobacteria bacterium]MDP2347805.1 organoarsenical effux MFS transporter ArsJ [Gammaproteobacteria bacterium]
MGHNPSHKLHMPLAQYLVITASYWAFTLTDGALRMLVVLFFHQLGFSPLEVAMLFVLYEFFGVLTNLFGGWLASRIGLNLTMHFGLALQILSLVMLLVDPALLTVAYVMVAQALSGIAKDLNKMSAKSSIKGLVSDEDGGLYRWVARLTGSKNALKGVGFFLGGALLASVGFRGALVGMAAMLTIVLTVSVLLLDRKLGVASFKPKFRDMFSSSNAINRLSAARFFLFSARDVWFVVALPVYLQSQLGWSHVAVGTMLAGWVIAYGGVQAIAPRITGDGRSRIMRPDERDRKAPTGKSAFGWAALLCLLPALISAALMLGWHPDTVLIIGLLAFGAVFAINSSVHSYLIVSWARQDGVSLDVGFYYMANAAGRLMGTVLSGLVYQTWGLETCLLASTVLVAVSALLARRL